MRMNNDQYQKGFMTKIIAEGCERWLLVDEPSVESLLHHIVKVIDMTPLSGPHTAQVKDVLNREMDDGISSVMIIMESTCAIHTWPYYKAVRIVVDSCCDYAVESVVSLLNDVLKPQQIRIADEVWRESPV
jgi:S-adenosylmethionine/arginine decarboxylase-like enzyme